jgi:hypothetical protein
MRIEVLIGNDDPVIYPINTQKMTLGASENCDIIVPDDGVSRKHLVILSEGDNYFVVDQGSTNGSFINESRLVPGRKVEFTSFFPLRLGGNVIVSLLSDDDNFVNNKAPEILQPKEPHHRDEVDRDESSSTKIFSLSSQHKATTEKLIRSRNQKRSAIGKKKPEIINKKPIKSKKKEFNVIPYVGILIVVAGAYFNYQMLEERVPEVPISVVGEVAKRVPEKAVESLRKEINLVPKGDLIDVESYKTLINDIKCATDIEKYLCDHFPGASGNVFGVVQVGLTANILVNGIPYFEEAQQYVKKPSDDSSIAVKKYEDLLGDTAIYLYLLRMNRNINQEMLKDLNLSVAFFKGDAENRQVFRVLSIRPIVFQMLENAVVDRNLINIKVGGAAALTVTKSLYRTY